MFLASLITALLPVAQMAANEPPALRHNPFLRPNLGAPLGARDTAAKLDQTLRATLVDGANSLANIDGTLVAVGEKIGEAQVVAISERSVTLNRDGENYTLHLDDKNDDDKNEE